MQVWSAATAGGAPKLLGDGRRAGDLARRHARSLHQRRRGDGRADRRRAPPEAALLRSRTRLGSAVVARRDRRSPSSRRAPITASSASIATMPAPLKFIAPTTSQDFMPRWSPDGAQIAFVRLHGRRRSAAAIRSTWNPVPWEIWVGDASSGAAHLVWTSPNTPRGIASADAPAGRSWSGRPANDLVFKSSQANWLHLYAVRRKRRRRASAHARRLSWWKTLPCRPDRAAVRLQRPTPVRLPAMTTGATSFAPMSRAAA